MRLTALVQHPEHVCARYRLGAFRPFLEAAGHSLELISWPSSFPSRLVFNAALWRADVVIVQRRLPSVWQRFLVRRLAHRLWFDYDDAVYLRDSYHPRGPRSPRLLRRFAGMVRSADQVLAGNAFLAAEAGRWTDPRKVQVLPTCVEVGRYSQAAHDPHGSQVSLAWIGSSSTLQGIEKIRGILENLGKKINFLNFRVICDRSVQMDHLPVHFCPWSEATEARDLAAADIGISWIPDDDWSRGKCGLKVLQYMAAGLPVVANPVGVHLDMIQSGENGFLVNSPEDWRQAVHALAHDPELRRRLGQAGRRLVEQRYDISVGAAAWLKSLMSPSAASRGQAA